MAIITRKQTGLYEDFESLISAMHQSVAFIEGMPSVMNVGGFDPIKSLAVIERQMIHVSENLKRSSNTGIGYAFSCEEIIKNL